MKRMSAFILSALVFGYAFLYVPLVLVIVYSFNDSRIATVWGGFSTRWYAALLQNDQVLASAYLSLRIALTSATLATILGTMAGLALARFGRFRGRTLFAGMITSPMVMPAMAGSGSAPITKSSPISIVPIPPRTAPSKAW